MSKTSTSSIFSTFLLGFALCLGLSLGTRALAIPVYVEPTFVEPSVRQLLNEGKFAQVRDITIVQLADNPNDYELLTLLAYAQAGLKDWDGARANIVRALSFAPDESQDALRTLLAEIHIGAGNVAEAESVLKKILSRSPDNTGAMLSLAFHNQRMGDTEQAIRYFDRILEVDPYEISATKALFQIYTAAGDDAAAARVAEQIPASSPYKGLGHYLVAVVILRAENPDYGTATTLLENSLAISKPTPQVLFTLGYVLNAQQRYEDAARRLLQSAALAPDYYDAHRLLGVVFLKLEQPRLAVRHLEKAVSIQESPKLRSLLAQTYLAMGRGKEGLGALMTSVENTSNANDDEESLQSLFSYTSGDFKQSEASVRRALEDEPDAQHLRVLLVASLLQQQRFEAAAREAQQAIDSQPDQQIVLFNMLGLARLGSREFDESEDALQRALALDPDSTTTRNNLSTLYMQTGEFAKARQVLNLTLEENPSDLGARIRLARVLQASNNFEAAESILLENNGSMPESLTLTRELFMLKNREGKPSEALDYANAMASRYPRVFESYVLQAHALASLGRADDARTALEQGFEIIGETQGSLAAAASVARVNGWHSMAINYLERYRTRFGLEDPKIAKLYAIELVEVGRTAEARDVIRQALSNTDPDALIMMARSYLVEGNQVRAEEFIDAALDAGVSAKTIERYRAELAETLRITALRDELAANPENASRYSELAGALELLGNLDGAISTYRDGIGKAGVDQAFQVQVARLVLKQGDAQGAIELAENILSNPDLAEDVRIQANAVVGMSWVLQRELDRAEPALERATTTNSELAPAFYELAKIKSLKGDLQSAIPLLQSAIKLDPESMSYYLALAAIYKRLGSIESSIAVYEGGIARNTNAVPLLNNLALIYMDQGNREKALSVATEALDAAPNNARIHDTLGRVYLLNEDHERAIHYLELAVDHDPGSSLYRYHLGMVYLQTGSKDLAKGELQRALERQTNAPWAPEIRRVLSEIGDS